MFEREINFSPINNLTTLEWYELAAIEYVLTHGYSDDIAGDEKRLKELRDKKEGRG